MKYNFKVRQTTIANITNWPLDKAQQDQFDAGNEKILIDSYIEEEGLAGFFEYIDDEEYEILSYDLAHEVTTRSQSDLASLDICFFRYGYKGQDDTDVGADYLHGNQTTLLAIYDWLWIEKAVAKNKIIWIEVSR